jgi:opacity protein-like surface antigen
MKYRVLAAVLCVLAMCASTGLALSRMGSPAGTLGAGKGDLGFDYMYAVQNIDFKNSKLDGVKEADSEGTIKRLDMQTGGVRFGYGLLDKWDVYGILGVAQASADSVNIADGEDFASSAGFMYGVGTKVTFWQDGALQVGALGQVGWMDSLKDSISTAGGSEVKVKASIMETQIAVGPTYEIVKGVSFYGGPFMHLLSGDIDVKWDDGAGERKADLAQSSQFGLYAGVEMGVSNATVVNFEYQHTSFADAVGANVTFRF